MSKTATPKPKAKMQYSVNGKAITNPSVNSLSGVAYFKTKGIDGLDRVGIERLEAILADLGVAHPKTEAFDVELPNGKRLSATVLEVGVAQSSTEPTAPTADVDVEVDTTTPEAPTEASSKPTSLSPANQAKLSKVEAMKHERGLVKAWEDAGGDLSGQPKPATPITDAANADLAAKEAKRLAERPETAHVAAIKPTNKDTAKRAAATAKKASAKPPVGRKQVTPITKASQTRRTTRKAPARKQAARRAS